VLDPERVAAVSDLIEEWIRRQEETNPVVTGVERVPDERRWLVRLRGEDKAIITLWLTIGERTLQYETYFIPAPEENIAECYEYLLRLNTRLYGMRFGIGDEDAVYLSGRTRLGAVDETELDHIIGTAYEYTEQHFRSALSIGFASRLRPLAAPGDQR
jgi:hypothetical protein